MREIWLPCFYMAALNHIQQYMMQTHCKSSVNVQRLAVSLNSSTLWIMTFNEKCWNNSIFIPDIVLTSFSKYFLIKLITFSVHHFYMFLTKDCFLHFLYMPIKYILTKFNIFCTWANPVHFTVSHWHGDLIWWWSHCLYNIVLEDIHMSKILSQVGLYC